MLNPIDYRGGLAWASKPDTRIDLIFEFVGFNRRLRKLIRTMELELTGRGAIFK